MLQRALAGSHSVLYGHRVRFSWEEGRELYAEMAISTATCTTLPLAVLSLCRLVLATSLILYEKRPAMTTRIVVVLLLDTKMTETRRWTKARRRRSFEYMVDSYFETDEKRVDKKRIILNILVGYDITQYNYSSSLKSIIHLEYTTLSIHSPRIMAMNSSFDTRAYTSYARLTPQDYSQTPQG